MAYGVIGNTTVSGTVILGSSPGRPAPRSSSGLGRRPLTPVTRVQIPYGVQILNTTTSGRLHYRSGLEVFVIVGGVFTSNELIISQYQAIGRDEFTITYPQGVQLGTARQTRKLGDLFKASRGVEIFDEAGTTVLTIEDPVNFFFDRYAVHRTDPESGEHSELAHITKRFAWFNAKYDVDIAGYPQIEVYGESFQPDHTLSSQGRNIAQVNAQSPGLGRALMGKTAYRIIIEPGLDENVHAAVIGIAFALDMRNKKMRES